MLPRSLFIKQVFIGRRRVSKASDEEYERRIFILRKVVSNRIFSETEGRDNGYYIVSRCRAHTIIYKGMFLAYQLSAYFKDLQRSGIQIRIGFGSPAIFHQYFSFLEIGASLPPRGAQW